MKKLLSILLIITMISSVLFAVNVSAVGSAQIGQFEYTWFVRTECTVTGLVYPTEDLVIPEVAELADIKIPVTAIGYGAFENLTDIKSVTLPDSLKRIEDNAFSGCTGITSITIPDGVTYIGNNAFAGCTWITSVTIPDGVTYIGNNAFAGCTSLQSVTVCGNIGEGAFSGCSGLQTVTIKRFTAVEKDAFKDCGSITTVNYGGSERELGALITAEGNGSLLSADIGFAVPAAEPVPATKEEYDNMQKTADFVCSIYFADAVLNENHSYVTYIWMILEEAAKAYPDKAEYWEDEDDAYHVLRLEAVRLTEEEAVSVIRQKYSYICDETLDNMYTYILFDYLCNNAFVLTNPGGTSAPYVKNAQKGKLEGYKDNKDGTYSLYFSFCPEASASDVLTEEELEEYYKLEEEANGEDFEYNGHKFYYNGAAGYYYTYGELEYREFNFSLTDDGKVIYNYDMWGVELPEKFDKIPTDIIPGDMNGDDQTDNKDVVTLFRAVSGNSGGYNAAFDFNEDGEVNNKDVVALFRFVSAAK